jgi:hypothetical protein
MFKPRNLFKSFGTPKKTASGDLPTPAVPATAGAVPAVSNPKVDPAAAEEMQRRVAQVAKAGRFPRYYFFGVDPITGSITHFKGAGQAPGSLLLFTSPLSLKDYLRVAKNPSGVAGFKMDDLPIWSNRWKGHGLNSVLMNPCPRCASNQAFQQNDGLISKAVIDAAFATSLAKRGVIGEPLVRQFLAESGDDAHTKRRAILENLRDHVDYSVPYVHQLILWMSSALRDEEARSAAIVKLQEFGPQFMLPELNVQDSTDPKLWSEPVSKAIVGLLASFGLLNLQQNPAATQVEGANRQVMEGSQGNSNA